MTDIPQMGFNEFQQFQQLLAFQAMQQQNMQFPGNMQYPVNFAEMSKPAQETVKKNDKATPAKKDDDELSEDFEKYD